MSDGQILKTNKSIISARSAVFDAMFKSDMEESRSKVVEINDIDSKTMVQFLRFANRHEVVNLEKIAHKLIFAAEKYLFKELKDICLQSLLVTLNLENVLCSLLIAEQISDCEILFDECLNFISRHYPVLRETPEWKTLPQQTLLKIVVKAMPHFAFAQAHRKSTIDRYLELFSSLLSSVSDRIVSLSVWIAIIVALIVNLALFIIILGLALAIPLSPFFFSYLVIRWSYKFCSQIKDFTAYES